MKLISFAMVSLLAITVSAQPPHNTDTDAVDKYLNDAIQNMKQSQGTSAQNSQQSHDADIDMLDQILNDITQNTQQPQGAATHSAQQSPGATSRSAHQYRDVLPVPTYQVLLLRVHNAIRVLLLRVRNNRTKI
ncbi:hypothetical protein BASA50_001257 [Batrachochytrium salamandrivorans]|uniref:Uncharacterized protein n=1 Tax=Batrachochytrium salamandrivorans TaxID=1357716 RepID=A0ABQ8EVM7_9FUNG|nr:hypothetical protein BASA50_001257 [Batrachochytrium salamandrivorans]